MHRSLEVVFNRMQNDLQSLYEELNGQPDSVLNKKASPTEWSILQVMHHLIRAEDLALQYCQKKMSFDPEFKKAGVMTSLRGIAVTAYLASPLKYKAPELVSDEYLPETSTFWEVIKLWNTNRDTLKQFLDNLPEDLLNKEVYKHPVGGRTTIRTMLKFHEGHFNRHRKQIRRALEEHKYVV